MSTRRLRLVGPLLLGLLLSACGPHTDASIGMWSTPLDLQFARPDLAVPVPPAVVVKLLPAPPQVLLHLANPTVVPLPPPAPAPRPPVGCPAASAPGVPGKPLATSTLGAPAPGSYSYATKGTGTVSGGASSVSAPLPTTTAVTVSGSTQSPPDSTVGLEGGVPASGRETTYAVTTRLSQTVVQTDILMVSATSINLVKRQLTNAERTFDITPTPQVRLMVFGPVGTRWSSRGTDSGSAATLDYSGSIDAVTQVKICGVVTRAYRVSYTSTLTNPTGNEVVRTGTDSAKPATFTIAPQLGGLVLAQDVHSQDVRLYSDLSGYVGTNLDYASVLTELTPVLGAAPK